MKQEWKEGEYVEENSKSGNVWESIQDLQHSPYLVSLPVNAESWSDLVLVVYSFVTDFYPQHVMKSLLNTYKSKTNKCIYWLKY